MSELISVVVTVYNKEKYVRRCLQSILDQTYAHLEIICVDDGSTDNSAEIIKELAQEDDRIRYLYKENGGLVSCWKFGLARCNGKYVTMVDSDDWLLENALSDMVEKAEEFDSEIVVGGMANDRHTYVSTNMSGLFQGAALDRVVNNLFDRRGKNWISLSRCGKLYKTEFIKTNIKSEYAGNLLEDIVYVPPLILQANRVFFLDKQVYVYYQDDNSMSHAQYKFGDYKKYETAYKAIDKAISAAKKNHDPNVYDIKGYFLWIKIALLLHSALNKKEKIAELKNMMNSDVLKNTIKFYKIGKGKFKYKICKCLLMLRAYHVIVCVSQ